MFVVTDTKSVEHHQKLVRSTTIGCEYLLIRLKCVSIISGHRKIDIWIVIGPPLLAFFLLLCLLFFNFGFCLSHYFFLYLRHRIHHLTLLFWDFFIFNHLWRIKAFLFLLFVLFLLIVVLEILFILIFFVLLLLSSCLLLVIVVLPTVTGLKALLLPDVWFVYLILHTE